VGKHVEGTETCRGETGVEKKMTRSATIRRGEWRGEDRGSTPFVPEAISKGTNSRKNKTWERTWATKRLKGKKGLPVDRGRQGNEQKSWYRKD